MIRTPQTHPRLSFPGSLLSTALVRVEGLVKRYGAFTAVNGLSFTFAPGEVFGLLGPNGAGKSTTIKVLTTLLRPDEGFAEVGGHDVVRDPASVRELIGYVPQALSVDGALTGYENLSVMARLTNVPRSVRRSRIDEVLELLDLGEASNRRASTYSGGLIRRLEIGQAILHRPRLLILDEPTVGLDPVARRKVWDHLTVLRRQTDLGLLLTTHYMEEAQELCDTIAIMNRGQIAAQGSLEELRTQAVTPDATLDDLFALFVTSSPAPEEGRWKEARNARRTARRLG
jgi:ABC-2 type transport system ATP-binding protein